MAGVVVTAIETPLQDAVADLLRQSDEVAARLYPGEYRRPITPQSLATPDTRVLVARCEGRAMGLCVLFDRGDGTAELKRMIVDGGARGQGIGAALLRGVWEEAGRLGVRLILLEVGTRNTEAQDLYRGAGSTDRGPFPPYRASPISLFMERAV